MNSYDYKYEEVKKEHPAYLEYDYKEGLKEFTVLEKLNLIKNEDTDKS